MDISLEEITLIGEIEWESSGMIRDLKVSLLGFFMRFLVQQVFLQIFLLVNIIIFPC